MTDDERRERILHFLGASEDERKRMRMRTWHELADADPADYEPGFLEQLRGLVFLNVAQRG